MGKWALFAATCLLAGCDASATQSVGGGAAPAESAEVSVKEPTAESAQCRVMAVSEGCIADPLERPTRHRAGDRDVVLSREGSKIFSWGRAEAFDAPSARFAKISDCPVWQDVFVVDAHDVYVEDPASCGGDNCGGDYTGYSWRGLGVRHPARFHWLPGGYAVDDIAVYDRYGEGPLVGAHPETFEVLQCGGDEGFVVGHEHGAAGERWFRDGRPVSESAAFTP